MNLKKGLTCVAFGFLFVSVDFKLNLSGGVLNLLPAFVGWILFALAYSKLGKYTAYKPHLRWIPIVLAVYETIDWLLVLQNMTLTLPLVGYAIPILEIVYLFQLFGCLEWVAGAYAARLESRIHRLKILYISLLIAAFATLFLALTASASGLFANLTPLISLAIVVVIILICVTLFQLRKAIPNEDPALAEAGRTGDDADRGAGGFGSTGTT